MTLDFESDLLSTLEPESAYSAFNLNLVVSELAGPLQLGVAKVDLEEVAENGLIPGRWVTLMDPGRAGGGASNNPGS